MFQSRIVVHICILSTQETEEEDNELLSQENKILKRENFQLHVISNPIQSEQNLHF